MTYNKKPTRIQIINHTPHSMNFQDRDSDPDRTVELEIDGRSYRAPSEFICPITLEIMNHPMMSRSGHHYERDAIVSWLERSGSCPLTRQPLALSDLISDRNMQARIHFWKWSQGLDPPETEEEGHPSLGYMYLGVNEKRRKKHTRGHATTHELRQFFLSAFQRLAWHHRNSTNHHGSQRRSIRA